MVKNPPALQETQVRYLDWENPLEKKWLPTPVFLPGEFQGQKHLAGYSPWGPTELDMTERLTLYSFNNQLSEGGGGEEGDP